MIQVCLLSLPFLRWIDLNMNQTFLDLILIDVCLNSSSNSSRFWSFAVWSESHQAYYCCMKRERERNLLIYCECRWRSSFRLLSGLLFFFPFSLRIDRSSSLISVDASCVLGLFRSSVVKQRASHGTWFLIFVKDFRQSWSTEFKVFSRWSNFNYCVLSSKRNTRKKGKRQIFET